MNFISHLTKIRSIIIVQFYFTRGNEYLYQISFIDDFSRCFILFSIYSTLNVVIFNQLQKYRNSAYFFVSLPSLFSWFLICFCSERFKKNIVNLLGVNISYPSLNHMFHEETPSNVITRIIHRIPQLLALCNAFHATLDSSINRKCGLPNENKI